MKPAILILSPIFAPTMQALDRDYVVHKLWEQPDPEAWLAEPHPGIRAIVTSGLAGFKGAQLVNLPDVEVAVCFGVAHGTLDLPAARERGVKVANTPDDSTDAVADIALGLVLAVMRRICEADRFVRAGRWAGGPFPMAAALKGRVCGIIGFGRIGRAVAERLHACGMKVSYQGPRQKTDVGWRYFEDVTALAEASDCLVVCCPLTPQTRGLVDAGVLAALGPGGFLVNIARGPIVDEGALVDALERGSIAGAALDVHQKEPFVAPELRSRENVVVTPHIGTSTQEIREARGALLLANLAAHFDGKPLISPVLP